MPKLQFSFYEAVLNSITGSQEVVLTARTIQDARAKLTERYPKWNISYLRKVGHWGKADISLKIKAKSNRSAD